MVEGRKVNFGTYVPLHVPLHVVPLHVMDQVGLSQDFRHEGIVGTLFTGQLIGETRFGQYPAVIPTLTGTGWIYAISQYVLDAEDPFPEGFRVGDIWGM